MWTPEREINEAGSRYVPYAAESIQFFCGDSLSFYGTVMLYFQKKCPYTNSQLQVAEQKNVHHLHNNVLYDLSSVAFRGKETL